MRKYWVKFVWRVDDKLYKACQTTIPNISWKIISKISNKNNEAMLTDLHFFIKKKLLDFYNFWDNNIVSILIGE